MAQPAAPATPDLSTLTSIMLLQTLAQLESGLLQLVATPSAVHSPSTRRTPQTPPQMRGKGTTASSPPIPSPSQLARYLQYAEANLGVRHALSYKPALEMHRIGPDILPNVDDKLLSNLGISAGDSIRLKKGSVAWWNGADVKRKRSNTLASSDENPDQQSSKRLSYKKEYHDGGGCRFSAPPMQKDDNDDGLPLDRDYDLFYRCETLKQWLPVPRGYLVDENPENPELDAAE